MYVGTSDRADVFRRSMQEREAGVAARHHQRYIEHGRYWQDHASQGVLLKPDLDVAIGVGPEGFPVEAGGIVERLLDAGECPWLPLPPGIVGQPVVRESPCFPHQYQVRLHLGVAGLGLLDDVANGGLVVHLSDRHRLHRRHDLEQVLPAVLDLGLG
jgi:hypothetical protein